MPESDIGYYISTDPSIASDLNGNGFKFSNITLLDLRKSFCSIKSNATGCDEMHPKFLKIILDYIIIYIKLPSKWKQAKIIPIPKYDKSYRPLAILPYLSNTFVRLVHYQISKYLNDSSLLTTATADVVEELRSKLD